MISTYRDNVIKKHGNGIKEVNAMEQNKNHKYTHRYIHSKLSKQSNGVKNIFLTNYEQLDTIYGGKKNSDLYFT